MNGLQNASPFLLSSGQLLDSQVSLAASPSAWWDDGVKLM